MEINNEFIPYEQALALKELGFDELCFAYFKYEEFRCPNPYEPFKNSEMKSWCITAPLYQQAFRWFREKYGLSGNIDCCDKLCEWNIKSSKLDKSIFSNKIQSYEEAELECLKKIIELCKK